MEQEEIRDIIIAALALSAAFAIAFQGGAPGILGTSPFQLLGVLVFSIVIVFASFVLHELGHRQLARRFGAYAEFKKWNLGLVLALLTSLAGFIFAAPGAVMIHARADLWGRTKSITRKKLGMISLVGPAINIALALVFLGLHFVIPSLITIYGFGINAWLAFFNLLPIPPLDGSKVFLWDKRIWLASIIISGIMIFVGL